MNQIAEALAAAGYQDAEDWPSKALLAIVEKAMIDHASDYDALQRAIFDACCSRNSLARALFLPWYREATTAVIAEFRRLLKAAERAENLNDQQRRIVKIVRLEDDRALAAARAARQREMEERGLRAAARQAEVNEWLKNKARHEQIDGEHWFKATPARIHAHAGKFEHMSKFWTAIAGQLSIYEDKRPASDFLRPDEIDPIWDKAWGNEIPN